MRRSLALAAIPGVAVVTTLASGPAYAAPTVSFTTGVNDKFSRGSDTPSSMFIDKDGLFHFENAVAQYGSSGPRVWTFYTGANMKMAVRDATLSDAVNPSNAQDKNNDTTWRCNNSPTGQEATADPSTSTYTQKNFCDLVAVFVSPDTGQWFGLVHDEFTPQPFGDPLHYDSIDTATSADQGKTWTITGHAITSPYSTKRGDTTAFPNQTYDYGDGDPRLYVDYRTGYFYVYYGSRVVNKSGGSTANYEHVARAPISGKMTTGSWTKYYNGSWSQPGIGGKESDLTPVTGASPTGYLDPSKEYSPANTGTIQSQITAGTAPDNSPLFMMDIAYDAYLGKYIGEPAGESSAVSGTINSAKQYYVTDSLANPKWTLLGGPAGFGAGGWYRWLSDTTHTSGNIVGKDFINYCNISCASGRDNWTTISTTSSAPAAVVDTSKTYTLAAGTGWKLTASGTAVGSVPTGTASSSAGWKFAANGDGSYQILNVSTGTALGVDPSVTTSRAWGTAPTLSTVPASGATVGQQWWVLPNESGNGFRLINRFSTLAIGLSPSQAVETTPPRTWTDTTGNPVGAGRTAAEQTFTFTAQ